MTLDAVERAVSVALADYRRLVAAEAAERARRPALDAAASQAEDRAAVEALDWHRRECVRLSDARKRREMLLLRGGS